MTLRRGVLACVLAAASIVACQVVAGIDRVEKQPRPDASGPPDPCVRVQPPPPPETDDDGGASLPPFYLAVRTVTFSGTDPGVGFGAFDLDNVCTCDRRGTAADGGPSCRSPQPGSGNDCDADGGVDNSAGGLLGAAAFGPGISVENAVTDDITDGKQGLLIHISEYNGTANDPDVRVGMMVSGGISDGSGCQSTASTATNFRPGWCDKDKWDYPPGATVSLRNFITPFFRYTGYVRGGLLVLRGKDTEPLAIGFGEMVVNVGAPVMAARLARIDGRWTMNGVIGGRVTVEDLLGAVGQSAAQSDGGSFACTDALFAVARKLVCNNVDVTAASARDFQNDNCNALSASIGFTAEPAELGSQRAAPPNSNPCAPANLAEKSIYSCP